MKVFVAHFEHKHGGDIRVFGSHAKAQAWKDKIGLEYWPEVSSDPLPEDPCGDEYFDLINGEWFSIEECEVE
jgi:hypothetical protein